MNDKLSVPDGSTTDIQGWAESGKKPDHEQNIWSKCRENVVSLLTFKHTTSLEIIPAETSYVNIPTPPASPSSSISSFSTLLYTPSCSTVITSPPTSEDRVAFVTGAVSLAASSRTPVSECSATSPVEPTAARLPEASQTSTNAANVLAIQGLGNKALVKPASVGTLAVACYPHSSTPSPAKLASPSVPEHSASTKRPVNGSALPSQAGIGNPGAASTTATTVNPSTATSATNQDLPKCRGGTAISKPRPVPLTFKVLVEELQLHQHRGHHRPTRIVIAAGLMKRDQLVFKRAGIMTGKRFCKYLSLAVKAEIVIIGGGQGKEDWVSLNPAWQFKDGLMALGNTL
jgi:hypothetical protein